jgi:hypothetical protein
MRIEMEYVNQILAHLNLDGTVILKRPIRGLKGYTVAELIHALIISDSVIEAATKLGYSDNPIKQSIRKVFKDTELVAEKSFAQGGREPSWDKRLLACISCKRCRQCNEIYNISEFWNNKSKADGHVGECIYCGRERSISKKLVRGLRVPTWYAEQRAEISAFYRACPAGYHVDHILPLQGDTVSGLHVIQNLQYLTAEANIAKGNRLY